MGRSTTIGAVAKTLAAGPRAFSLADSRKHRETLLQRHTRYRSLVGSTIISNAPFQSPIGKREVLSCPYSHRVDLSACREPLGAQKRAFYCSLIGFSNITKDNQISSRLLGPRLSRRETAAAPRLPHFPPAER